MRRVGYALFGLVFLTGCSGCATVSPQYKLARIGLPPSFFNMVSVRTQAGTGWGTPLPSGVIITVNHIVPEGIKDAVWADTRGRNGKAGLVWQNERLDLAAYRQADSSIGVPSVEVDRHEPELGEILCYRNYLPREVPSFGCGPYLGADMDGEGHIDGWASGGVSGSGVIDEAGRLRGVVYAGANWAGSIQPVDIPEALRSLNRKTHFRSTVIFVLAKNLPEGY